MRRALFVILACFCLFGCNKSPVAPTSSAAGTASNPALAKRFAAVEFVGPGVAMASGPTATIGVAPLGGTFELTDNTLDIDGIHVPDGLAVYEPSYSVNVSAYSNTPGDLPSIHVGNSTVTWDNAAVEEDGKGGFRFQDQNIVSFNGETRIFSNNDRNVDWPSRGDHLLVNSVPADSSTAVVLTLLTSQGETRQVGIIKK